MIRILGMQSSVSHIAAIAMLMACGFSDQSVAEEMHQAATGCEFVTFIEVIANPKQFDGHCIRISGVLALGFEEQKLYMSWDFYESYQIEYSIPVDVQSNWKPGPGGPESPRRAFLVVLEGTFKAFPATGLHVGRIVDVRSIDEL